MESHDRERIRTAFADLSETVRDRALALFDAHPEPAVGGLLLALARSRDFRTQINDEQIRRIEHCTDSDVQTAGPRRAGVDTLPPTPSG